jgi:hypothetical protein
MPISASGDFAAVLDAEERSDRAFLQAHSIRGLRVAIQPAMMPAPGSIVDHIDMFVAFPVDGTQHMDR